MLNAALAELNHVAPKKLSTQMRAVLLIFKADPYLMNSVEPWVDLTIETINWTEIFKIPFGSGHKGAISFAFSVWTDEIRARSNPFSGALSMSADLQKACLQALALRWGLTR